VRLFRYGTLPGVTEVLRGLDDIDWRALHDAYGTADELPSTLRNLLASDDATRVTALGDLWMTVCHQGTVYECSPVVVPFLVAAIGVQDLDDGTRAQLALLLASIASAVSFVLPNDPAPRRPSWLRQPGDEIPTRDLTEESRTAVAACVDQLGRAFAEAPVATAAGLVAVFATIADVLPSPAREKLLTLESRGDARLAAAARLTRMLAADASTITDADLQRLAATDAEAADYLESIADWPVRVRAVELVRELSERVVSADCA
jgi:hypothetical protein